MLPLIAYLDKISAAPGDRVEVKVGSYGAKSYRADLRRLIQGDINPQGPGYRDEPVSIDLGGERPARAQKILPGSYVTANDRGDVLAALASFTIAVPVQPTARGGIRTVLSIAGRSADLLRIGLDSDGRPQMMLSDRPCLTLPEPAALGRWSVLIASHDAEAGVAELAMIPTTELGELRSAVNAQARMAPGWSAKGAVNTLIGASTGPSLHFDGKIDSPAVWAAPLGVQEAAMRLCEPARLIRDPRLVAFWDFSQLMETTAVRDASPHRLDGTTVQTPARASTGWRWLGQAQDWRVRPDLYSAIHFHSDDITDAGWDTDFSFRIPEGLKSGVYAVRLVPDGKEVDAFYCVLAVRPSHALPTGNSVCFLLPTASYLAYANHRSGLDVPGTEIGMGRLVELDRHHLFLQEHPEVGSSFYETHGDGSGVFYSSRLRPILDLQPKVKGFLGGFGSNIWQFNADTHITGWLEREGIAYDVITDEDLHAEGLSLLRRYRVVITGTHPEYQSLASLDALQAFVDRGGRLMYLGGNGFYWRISFSPHHPGVIECRRSESGIRPWEPGHGQYHHAFTGEHGGLWRRNGRSSALLTGVVMAAQGFDIGEPYYLTPAAADPRVRFLFDGLPYETGRQIGGFGLSGGGAAGLEVDRADLRLGTPRHALVIASSHRHTDVYLLPPEELLDPTPDWSGTQTELIRADLVFFETDGGGAVFSTGSIAWAGAIAWNGYDNEIARLTSNALRRFDDPAPFILPPMGDSER